MAVTWRQLRDLKNDPIPMFTGDGAQGTLTFKVVDSDDAAVDITGFDVRVIGKRQVSDTDANAVFAEEAATESNQTTNKGEFTVDFSAINISDTGSVIFLIFRNVVATKSRVMAIYYTDLVQCGC